MDTPFSAQLFIFSFSGSFRFLFTSNAWFFVMLSFTNLLLNSCLSTAPLKSAKSAV